MAITDNLVFRLRAASGQTAPRDEISNANMTSAATLSLVDRGSGDYAWQFTGGTATNNNLDTTKSITTALNVGSTVGDGVTIAVTLKVITGPSVDFSRYCALRQSGNDAQAVSLTQNGAGNLRARFVPASGATTNVVGTISATEYTHVFRVKTTSSSNVLTDTWKTTSGRVGTTQDTTCAPTSVIGATGLVEVLIRTTNGDTIQVKDFCVWARELTDTECATVSDNLRGVMDVTTIACTVGNAVAAGSTASVSSATTISCTVGNAVAAGSSATIGNAINCTVGNAVAAGLTASIISSTVISCTVGNTVAAGSTAAVANWITTDIFTANTNSDLVNTGIYYSWYPLGRIGSLTGITPTEGTGTTDSVGKFVSPISHLTSGAGMMLLVHRNGSAVVDDVAYQAFA